MSGAAHSESSSSSSSSDGSKKGGSKKGGGGGGGDDGEWSSSVLFWVIAIVVLLVGFGIGFGAGWTANDPETTGTEYVLAPQTASTSRRLNFAGRSESPKADPGYGDDQEILDFMETMTVDEKIGQMILADVQLFLDKNDTNLIDKVAMKDLMSKYPFGSVFNAPGAGFDTVLTSVDQWQAMVTAVNEVAAELNLTFPLYGIDTVHGANYVQDAAIFPQQLSTGCTFNRVHANTMGVIGGRDTRAAGIGWNFSPILDVATHPAWPRNYETFGESPYLAGELAKELLNGYQGVNGSGIHENTKIAASMKHFLGYPASVNGMDRSPVNLGDATVMNIYMPVYEAGISVNSATIMSGFHCQNDDPAAGSVKYLRHLLRDYAEYPGLMVTDYNTVEELFTLHHMFPTVDDALLWMFRNTTTDVTMSSWEVESHFLALKAMYEDGRLTDSDLEVPVYRMLALKKKLGWNVDRDHRPTQGDWEFFGPKDLVGQEDDWTASLEAARESMVLVKNDDVLPIDPDAGLSVLITGPAADSAPWMSGGWTCHWQGCVSNDQFGKTRTLKAFFEDLTTTITVTYSEGLQAAYPTDNDADTKIAAAVGEASGKDLVIIAVGEHPYTERVGNIEDITLEAIQVQLIRELQAANANNMLVVYEGRPRVLPPDIIENTKAIMIGYLPGPMAGQAAGEIIVGSVNPSGALSFTYPGNLNETPFLHYHKWSFSSAVGYDAFFSGSEDWCHTDCYGKPLWEFGYGLSYSDFTYDITSPTEGTIFASHPGITVEVVVDVSNAGPLDGMTPVLLFVSDLYRVGAAPEYKLLKAFDKVTVADGASLEVTFTLDKSAFEFHTVLDPFSAPIIEDGTFILRVGVGDKEVTRTICLGVCDVEDEVA